MAGEIEQPKRPRYQSNERFDTVDANAASLAPRDHDDALTRAFLSTPRNVAASPTGLIVTGFSLTPNPTAGNDGLLRINAETGVALDSDGRTIIKPTGTTLDISIPIGTFQLYVYYVETPTDVAKRRFLPALAPFIEFTQAIDTAFQGDVGMFLRGGGLASAVASDVVNGATTSLCLIGIATNAGAGAITITGFGPAAPNGADITNRLSTVVPPTLAPAANTINGSPKTLHDLITAVLYTAGQTAWKGSDFLTPALANNFGAYSIPAGGADKAFRQALGWVTIGNGTTVKGDFNTSDYGNAKLLLDAALASLPTGGGTIFFKRGITLTGFGGTTVTMPAGKAVEIVGSYEAQGAIGFGTATITFAAGEKFICATGGTLTLRNVGIHHIETAITITTTTSGAVNVLNCAFNKPNGTDAGAALQGVDVYNLTLEDVSFYTTIAAAAGVTTAMAVRVTGIGDRVQLRRVYHLIAGDECGSVSIVDLRDNFLVDDYECASPGTAPYNVTPYLIALATTTNSNISSRVIRNLRAVGTTLAIAFAFNQVLTPGNVGWLLIDGMVTRNCKVPSETVTSPADGVVTFRKCDFMSGLADASFIYADSSTDVAGHVIERCSFTRTGTTSSNNPALVLLTNSALDQVRVSDCVFKGFKSTTQAIDVIDIATTGDINEIIVERCRFLDFQNVAYVGGAGVSSLISVDTAANVRALMVRDNHTSQILGSSGRDQAYLLATDVSVALNILITGNVLGYVSEQCGLWIHNAAGLTSGVQIKDNIINIGQLGDFPGFLQGAVVHVTIGTHYNMMISGNVIEVANGSDYTKDMIYISAVGRMMQIADNHFNLGRNFGYVSAWGINLAATNFFTMSVAGNSCLSSNVVTTDPMRIKSTGTMTTQLNDITPGAGVPIAGNIGVYGNA